MWIHAEATGKAVYRPAVQERMGRCLADKADVMVRVSGTSACAPFADIGRGQILCPLRAQSRGLLVRIGLNYPLPIIFDV